jgi:hypothetical protein
MVDIAPQRINIQEAETNYKASVSEALLKRVGASTNFINDSQYVRWDFKANGPYKTGPGLDGAIIFEADVEISAVSMYNLIAGTSGTTTIDIRRYTSSNTPAGGTSIFSVKPSISFTAGNYAYVSYNFVTSTALENPSGTTLPVLSTVNLNAGDMLVLNIDAVQVLAQNCGLSIGFRPR